MDRNIFLKQMIASAVSKGISEDQAQRIMNKYIDKLEVSDSIVRHIGPEYYAYQILINEKLVDFVALQFLKINKTMKRHIGSIQSNVSFLIQ